MTFRDSDSELRRFEQRENKVPLDFDILGTCVATSLPVNDRLSNFFKFGKWLVLLRTSNQKVHSTFPVLLCATYLQLFVDGKAYGLQTKLEQYLDSVFWWHMTIYANWVFSNLDENLLAKMMERLQRQLIERHVNLPLYVNSKMQVLRRDRNIHFWRHGDTKLQGVGLELNGFQLLTIIIRMYSLIVV